LRVGGHAKRIQHRAKVADLRIEGELDLAALHLRFEPGHRIRGRDREVADRRLANDVGGGVAERIAALAREGGNGKRTRDEHNQADDWNSRPHRLIDILSAKDTRGTTEWRG